MPMTDLPPIRVRSADRASHCPYCGATAGIDAPENGLCRDHVWCNRRRNYRDGMRAPTDLPIPPSEVASLPPRGRVRLAPFWLVLSAGVVIGLTWGASLALALIQFFGP